MNQATALQSLFAGLTDRAMSQNHISSLEIFLRLALKAQSQCRATLEQIHRRTDSRRQSGIVTQCL